MRRTSYVAAGYLIAEVTARAADGRPGRHRPRPDGHGAVRWCLVGLISYLLIYLVSLIRDLDNPFEYLDGKPGAADVSLDVLERNEDRLRALLGALDPAPVEPAPPAAPREPSV